MQDEYNGAAAGNGSPTWFFSNFDSTFWQQVGGAASNVAIATATAGTLKGRR